MTPRDRPEPLPSLKILQRQLEDDGITGRAVHLARAARLGDRGMNVSSEKSTSLWMSKKVVDDAPAFNRSARPPGPALRAGCDALGRYDKAMWNVIKTAANDWLRHHDARLGAALAYYSVFSLGPLLLIVVSIAGVFFGTDAVREALTGQFRSLLGPTGSQAVEAMLKGASWPTSGKIAGAVGVLLLLVAAPRCGRSAQGCA